MIKLILVLAVATLSFAANAELSIKEGYAIEGKIFAVKTAKKYSSVEGCSAISEKKSKVAGFTFDVKTQKCTLYKKVRKLKERSGSVSGTK